MNFERIIEFTPAFDRRDVDPSKNYGIHGVDLCMVLQGAEGAVQFVLYTNWHLPEVAGSTPDPISPHYDYARKLSDFGAGGPLPADLGYHSPRPIYEGQTPMSECKIIDGPCYYDGSGLNAWMPFEALLREGHAGVWRVLEDYYRETFAADA